VSTAFERVFIERGDFIVFHEPFSEAFFFGPERGHTRFADRPIKVDRTFRKIWADIKQSSAHTDRPSFVKELAFHLPLTPLRGEIMAQSTHTFLVRHPHKALASMYRKLPDFDWIEAGYEGLYEIFEESRRHQPDQPTVIDADHLQQHPDIVMRAYCRRLGIPFMSDSLRWKPKIIPAWNAWEGWHEEAQFSNGLRSEPSTKEDGELPDWVLRMIERAMPFYLILKSHCDIPHMEKCETGRGSNKTETCSSEAAPDKGQHAETTSKVTFTYSPPPLT